MSKSVDRPAKVASLNGKRKVRRRITRAQSLMHQCRGRLREHLAGALPGIMDQVDDALFDLADKADTNQLQSVYFEAMRSVRLVRDGIEARFLEELEMAIEQRVKAASNTVPADSLATLSVEAFTLVDQDELEESLAVRNIAGKIRNVCHEDLFALDRRIALLLGAPNLEGDENPIGPEVLGAAARGAVSIIEAALEIRLLVLKLFDRHLCRAGEQFYTEINDWLVREGVLPDVRAAAQQARRRPGAPRRVGTGESAGPAPGAGGTSAPHVAGGAAVQAGVGGAAGCGWGAFHEPGPGSAAPGDGFGGPHAGSDSAAAAVDGFHGAQGAPARGASTSGMLMPRGSRRVQMLGVLDQVMRLDTAAGDDPAQVVPQRAQFIVNLTELQRNAGTGDGLAGGNVIRELRVSSAVGDVCHADSLMIDVVAMMFDYILQDQNLGDAMRALVGRLQIPVLKVAILDKTFFARRTHPVRQFINTLAEFGAREEGGGSAVFERVRGLVERILDEFDTEVDVFVGALEELETILGEDDHASEENAWATAKVAEERERLSAARRRADQELEERLAGEVLPACVEEFLRSHWRHLMAERLFRHGDGSDEWRAAVVTMERLLWSVHPKPDKESRDRLLALLPFLLEQLKLGMHEIGLAADARGPILRSLSELHVAALRDPGAAVAGPSEPVVGTGCEAKPHVEPQNGRAAPGEVTAALLRQSVERANALVWNTAEQRPQCQGMGATVVAVKLEANLLVCAHAGDSRLYRLRQGSLEQLSHDHTYRNEMVARGLASEAGAEDIASNLITRAVGGDAGIEAEVNVHDTSVGDVFMLCSDGLSDMVDDNAIEAIMTDDGRTELHAVANALIAAANEAGGKDNISVGLLRVDHALPESAGGAPNDYTAFISVHAATDPGRRRAHNEDAIESDATSGCVVLADGMGGHNAGEVASAMAVNLLMDALRVPDGSGAGQAFVDRAAETGEFDFTSINADFWDEAVEDEGNTALYDAVAEEVENIVLAAHDNLECFNVDAPDSADLLEENAARDPLLARVLQLTPGVWVEFGEVVGAGQRARLSWVSPDKTRYLFTDRFGQKVSESTAYGLALELRGARLRVLNVVPLFDRVVNRVSRTLRSQDEGQVQVA